MKRCVPCQFSKNLTCLLWPCSIINLNFQCNLPCRNKYSRTQYHLNNASLQVSRAILSILLFGGRKKKKKLPKIYFFFRLKKQDTHIFYFGTCNWKSRHSWPVPWRSLIVLHGLKTHGRAPPLRASLPAAREKQQGSIIRKLHEIPTWKSDRFSWQPKFALFKVCGRVKKSSGIWRVPN